MRVEQTQSLVMSSVEKIDSLDLERFFAAGLTQWSAVLDNKKVCADILDIDVRATANFETVGLFCDKAQDQDSDPSIMLRGC